MRQIRPARLSALALGILALHAPAGGGQEGEEPGDPVTGVWKGSVTGTGPIIPPAGVPATFRVRLGDDAVEGQLSLQGFDPLAIQGTFDAETGALDFQSSMQGIPMTVSLTIGEEALTGTISGLGMSFDVEAQRISHRIVELRPAPSAPVDLDALSHEAWTEDLHFLRDYLPQVHANAYHKVTAAEWTALAGELESRMPELDGLRRTVALAQLVARVGDAHTGLHFRETPGFVSARVRFGVFADGTFVTAIHEEWAEALGTRVVSIGSRPVDEVAEAVASVFAAENESWKRAQLPALLNVPELLAILRIADSAGRLPMVVEQPDGSELELVLQGSGAGNWVSAPDARYDPVPRWMTRRGENYSFDVIDEEGTVYLAYNRCAEDPHLPMSTFLDEVLEACELTEAERLVIDLRNNSGGNSYVLSAHLERLAAHPVAGRPGATFALIGPVTYSSGMTNAHQLRDRLGATLVGEPTGGKPNSYGEVRSFRLPRSGLKVFYSTKYFRLLEEELPAIEPDVLVELTAEDYFSGHDPVLARVHEE